MTVIDRYIFKQILIATVFVTLVLAALIFLMQSLRFIDLVINSGASGIYIWLQTFLYLPGFFEIILPIGTVAAVLFIYNRLTMDSELIVLRGLGFSPARLARPAILLSGILAIILFFFDGVGITRQ
jgi:lipopolysaccharide export system permease protein